MTSHFFYIRHHRAGQTAAFATETDLLNAYPSTGERVNGEGVSVPVLKDMLGPFFRPVRFKHALICVVYETREHRIATSQ